MGASREELLKAIKAKANANSTLSTAISSDIFFDHIPNNPTEPNTMPYITYHFITDVPIDTFAGGPEDVTIQFSIFDDRPGVANIEAITSDLDLVFDRATLTYDTATSICCLREMGTGPTWLPDDRVWMRTVDYRIIFEHP